MFDWAKGGNSPKKESNYLVKTRSTKITLKLKKLNTEKYKKSFAYKGPKKWNSLPEEFHQPITKHAFELMVENRITTKAKVGESGDLVY